MATDDTIDREVDFNAKEASEDEEDVEGHQKVTALRPGEESPGGDDSKQTPPQSKHI